MPGDPEHRWRQGRERNAESRLRRCQVCGLGVIRHCDQMCQAHQTNMDLIEGIFIFLICTSDYFFINEKLQST